MNRTGALAGGLKVCIDPLLPTSFHSVFTPVGVGPYFGLEGGNSPFLQWDAMVPFLMR